MLKEWCRKGNVHQLASVCLLLIRMIKILKCILILKLFL
jgi:hypothetical protein